jgi:hypothetical protein
MNDNISRALEAHPTPWHSDGLAILDANGKMANPENWREFVTEIVNAYAANRERDGQVKALVEAVRSAPPAPPVPSLLISKLELVNYFARWMSKYVTWYGKRTTALAPFKEPTP